MQSSTIHLVLRLRGGGGGITRVRIGGVVIFKGRASHVGELKMKIFHSLGIFPHLQNYGLPDGESPKLVHHQIPNLRDALGLTTTVLDEILSEGYTLDLQILAPEPLTMGIGPGGSITQKIHADTSDPRIWDVANSKILYVHLVNSEEFEAITGLPPPKPPNPRNEVTRPGSTSSDISEQEFDMSESMGRSNLTLLEPDQTVPWFDA